MKFGETLYERSIPKWAAYNFNYNDIKRMIKRRTTKGIAEPVPIPGQSKNRWADLEDELFQILKAQHDNISLFLRSKYGEIDRRLAHLERQLRGAQRAVETPDPRSVLRARRYHKLLQEAESIGEDVQALSRFASVQKVAFRKILKKYRKWTHSMDLQTRLERDVFAKGGLELDFAQQLNKLSTQTRIITQELQGPMLRGESSRKSSGRVNSPVPTESPVPRLNEAAMKSTLHFDAAFDTLPYGASAGFATYWVHPDNLEEARVLLLRHMQELNASAVGSTNSSMASLTSQIHKDTSNCLNGDTHTVFYDNLQRFVQDQSVNRPSRIAFAGRWGHGSDAVVTMTSLSSRDLPKTSVALKRKDLSRALARTSKPSATKRRDSVSISEFDHVQEYLFENRDLKPLGELHSTRSRFSSSTTSPKVGTWAVLDADVVFSTFSEHHIDSTDLNAESGEAFPHAVLQIRWEFGHTPEVVRAFDTSHLAEKVRDFSLESATVCAVNNGLEAPVWKDILNHDIRKVPITSRVSQARKRNSVQLQTGSSSGPSSTEGPTDSIFSTAAGHSSNTSEGSPSIKMQEATLSVDTKQAKPPDYTRKKEKRARINAVSPPGRPTARYWNEFDDGDSDTNPEDAYMIYVNPDEKFPGTETVAKAFEAVRGSFHSVTNRATSWWSRSRKPKLIDTIDEHTPLIISTDVVIDDSSDSDSSPTSADSPVIKSNLDRPPIVHRGSVVYQDGPRLSSRRRALERTYFRTYTGLFILSYILLFMSGMMLSTGRKKARIQVDSGIIIGSVMAEFCAVVALVLAWTRRTKLGVVHWGLVSVSATGVAVIGMALLAAVLGREAT